MATKKKKEVAKEVDSDFLVSIKIGTQIYEGTGITALAALMAVPRPVKVMGKTLLTITQGDKKKDMWFMPDRAKRLFYPQAQPFLAKQIALGMK